MQIYTHTEYILKHLKNIQTIQAEGDAPRVNFVWQNYGDDCIAISVLPHIFSNPYNEYVFSLITRKNYFKIQIIH